MNNTNNKIPKIKGGLYSNKGDQHYIAPSSLWNLVSKYKDRVANCYYTFEPP
jgi:hypothetical protein